MSNELALVKKDVVDVVASKVKQFQESGELHFPAGYSPENAMKSAWLMLQEVEDRNKQKALAVCTKDSIANSLLDMVVQGLNPAKKQGYFIVYGKTLTFQRSYFGTMAVTKRLTGAKSIDAMTIHEGDKVSYEIVNGRYVNLKHEQEFGSTNKRIIGAYCTIIEKNGNVFTELMTQEEIEKSWGQSKMNPKSETSTHSKFPVEMTKKTITNRACKRFLNSSDDSSLMLQTVMESDERRDEAQVLEEIGEKANQVELDFDMGEPANMEPQDAEYVEVSENQKADTHTGEIFTTAPENLKEDDEIGF